MHAVLGFLMNLSYDSSVHLSDFGACLSETCCLVISDCSFTRETHFRAWNVISHILPACEESVQIIVHRNLIKALIKYLQVGL